MPTASDANAADAQRGQARNSGREDISRSVIALLIVSILLIDGVIAAAAPPIDIWYLLNVNSSAQIPLESGAALIAVITFVGIWLVQRLRSTDSAIVDMRNAISGAFILVYLVIFCWVAFFPPRYNTGTLSSLSSTLITNFTVLTGVVVGFYFTTTAASQIAIHRKDERDTDHSQ